VQCFELNKKIMKRIILAVLLFASIVCVAQKSKTVKVYEQYGVVLNAHVKYDSTNAPIDTSFHLMGRDRRYQHIIEYITISSSNGIKPIYRLAKKILESFPEDDGTSISFDGYELYVTKLLGMANVNVYGSGRDSNGYTSFSKGMAKNMIADIEAWAKKSKIVLE
jgi:hypothetical protein